MEQNEIRVMYEKQMSRELIAYKFLQRTHSGPGRLVTILTLMLQMCYQRSENLLTMVNMLKLLQRQSS
jgi:hypothetical protein